MMKTCNFSFLLAILLAALAVLPRTSTAAPASNNKCYFVPQWLAYYQAANITSNFLGNCCSINNSDPNVPYRRRTVSCNAEGWPDTIKWRDELNGSTTNVYMFTTLLHPPIWFDVGASRMVMIPWVEIDLSGNKLFSGSLDVTWKYAGDTLKRLNLSDTAISGQIRRLDAIFPHLEELDLRGSNVSGYVPPMPQSLKVCKLPPTLCYYSEWNSSLVPDICKEGLPACKDSAPEISGTPVLPPPLRPHWGDVPLPVTDHGMRPLEEQITLALDFVEYHGMNFNRTLAMDNFKKALNSWIDVTGKNARLRVYWYRGYLTSFSLYCNSKEPLHGDINLPANTMSELKGLSGIAMEGCNLTGTFPDFVFGMSDLVGLSLANNQLSGPVPTLASLESLSMVSLAGNKLGPFAPITGGVSCRLVPQRGGKGCWEYDPEFSSPGCAVQDGNAPINRCSTKESVYSDAGPWCCYYHFCFGGVMVRQIHNSIDGETVQCKGPDSETCTYYLDSECTAERPPNSWDDCGCGRKRLRAAATLEQEGKVCSPSELQISHPCVCPYCVEYWCKYVWGDRTTFFNSTTPTVPPQATATLTEATTTTVPSVSPTASPTPIAKEAICVRSCADKGNYVLVRKFNGTVQCVGPSMDKCSWFAEPSCTVVADGEPAPEASGSIGYVCPQITEGWCKTARDQLYDGVVASCSLPVPTRTALAVSTTRPSSATLGRTTDLSMSLVAIAVFACFLL